MTAREQDRLRKIESMRYPGRPGYVPLPRMCVSVACGESHSLAIVEGGAVFLWGRNGSGQLGFPADKGGDAIHEPHLLLQLKGVDCMSAACGKDHCVVVTEGGGVYTWGAGQKGQLGTGRVIKEGSHNPVRVQHRRMWVSLQSTSRNGKNRPIVSCGEYHSGICSVRGDVWMWGDNKYGQVYGIRNDKDRGAPILVDSPINAMFPAAKASGPSMKKTSLLIKSKMGAIGKLTGASSADFERNNTDKKTLDSVPLLTLVPGETIIKLVTGPRHTVVMTSHGAIWGWGDNSQGQLGDGNHHKHHHHHHHHHHKHHKRRRASITGMLGTRADRLHIGGVKKQERKTKNRHHHHQKDQVKEVPTEKPKVGMSMPVLFSNVEAGDTYTVAFSVAGELWLWGELQGVAGTTLNRGKQSIHLISELLPGHVQGGELICMGENLVISTKLGVFSMESKRVKTNNHHEQVKTHLVARRLSILDGQDVKSLKLAKGPRLFAVLSHQTDAGMQVLRLKKGHTQFGSLEIVHTAGEHLQFEVSLRTHPSANATTRHGTIRRANYLSSTTRVAPPTKIDLQTSDAELSRFTGTAANISEDTNEDEDVHPSWAPWDDIEVQISGPHNTTVEHTCIAPQAPYRTTTNPPEVVHIDVTSKYAGPHWLNVTYRGAHVLGSPFLFQTLVGAPVKCSIRGHADTIGAGGIMRIGVANLINVSLYDVYGNQCILGPPSTEGCICCDDVLLLVNGKPCPGATCIEPTQSSTSLSLLFQLDATTNRPSNNVSFTVSIKGTLVAGSLLVQSVDMIRPSEVRVDLPKEATVGAPVEIKMNTITNSHRLSNGGEKFVVTVVGPKVRRGTLLGGSGAGGPKDLPTSVRDHGDGTYLCVVWPHLPGIHLVAVQHVSYEIVDDHEIGTKRQKKVLRQVTGSPFRFQALLPEAGSARRRRVVGSHLNKLHAIFNRLDIDQDGTVPSSSLASAMRREGSVSRLLDVRSMELMLGESEITKGKFVESLVGALPPEPEDDDVELERAALRIQAIQRGRRSRQDDARKEMMGEKVDEVSIDTRVERRDYTHGDGVSEVEVHTAGTGSSLNLLLREESGTEEMSPKDYNREAEAAAKKKQVETRSPSPVLTTVVPRGIQMRIVERKQQSILVPKRPKRPSSAGRRRPSSHKSPKRPTSAKLKSSPRSSSSARTRGSAWSGIQLRKTVREKLEVLQRGPYWKEIPGARRPKPDHVDILPGYGDDSAVDLQIRLQRTRKEPEKV
jgi:alpha-tubulin suppressor-like RCC1 family protein